MLFPMCDDLKRDFYSVCPVWYWPVLWWNLFVMERNLSSIYATSGRAEMTYGLSLGPRGQVRLVFLSDMPRSNAPYEHNPVMHCMQVLTHPPAEHFCFNAFAVDGSAPVCAAFLPSFLYLDPG